MRAYSKAGLPCSNWSRRKGAFWRSVYSATWTARSGGRWARVRVCREAILRVVRQRVLARFFVDH